jgi:hypothetical protein
MKTQNPQYLQIRNSLSAEMMLQKFLFQISDFRIRDV